MDWQDFAAIGGLCGITGSGIIYVASKVGDWRRGRKAFLAATIEDGSLEIYNVGDSGAKGIQFFIDGIPYLDHCCWPRNERDIRVLGPRCSLTRTVGYSLDCVPSRLSMRWESDHGIKGGWESSV